MTTLVLPPAFLSAPDVMRLQKVLPENPPKITNLIFPLIIKINYYFITINQLIN